MRVSGKRVARSRTEAKAVGTPKNAGRSSPPGAAQDELDAQTSTTYLVTRKQSALGSEKRTSIVQLRSAESATDISGPRLDQKIADLGDELKLQRRLFDNLIATQKQMRPPQDRNDLKAGAEFAKEERKLAEMICEQQIEILALVKERAALIKTRRRAREPIRHEFETTATSRPKRRGVQNRTRDPEPNQHPTPPSVRASEPTARPAQAVAPVEVARAVVGASEPALDFSDQWQSQSVILPKPRVRGAEARQRKLGNALTHLLTGGDTLSDSPATPREVRQMKALWRTAWGKSGGHRSERLAERAKNTFGDRAATVMSALLTAEAGSMSAACSVAPGLEAAVIREPEFILKNASVLRTGDQPQARLFRDLHTRAIDDGGATIDGALQRPYVRNALRINAFHQFEEKKIALFELLNTKRPDAFSETELRFVTRMLETNDVNIEATIRNRATDLLAAARENREDLEALPNAKAWKRFVVEFNKLTLQNQIAGPAGILEFNWLTNSNKRPGPLPTTEQIYDAALNADDALGW